jgi:hypothetical protein
VARFPHEILVMRSVLEHVPALTGASPQHRQESLKGYPVDAFVVHAPLTAAAG